MQTTTGMLARLTIDVLDVRVGGKRITGLGARC